ncbi:MAG: T9SS type A sorting domain-containing protein, partial [Bacteroidota bacterium]
LRKNGKVMKVQINQPADAEFSVLSTDPGDDRQRSNEGTRMLAIEYMSMNPTSSEIAVEFIPNDSSLSNFTNIESHSLASKSAIKAFPNPFSDEVTIAVDIDGNDAKCLIYDFTGRLIYSKLIRMSGSSSQFNWDGKNNRGEPVPAGIYMMKIQDNTSEKVIKLIKR